MNDKAPEGKLYGYIECPTCGVFLHKDKEYKQQYCEYKHQCATNSEAQWPVPKQKEYSQENE